MSLNYLVMISVLAFVSFFANGRVPYSFNYLTDTIVQFYVEDTDFYEQKGGPYNLKFTYKDTFGISHDLILLNGENRISFSTPILLVQNDLAKTPYYIEPGDEIKVKIEYGALIFLNRNGTINSQQNFFKSLIDSTGSIYFLNDYENRNTVSTLMELHQLENKINDLKNRRVDFLNAYAKKEKLKKSFYEFALSCISILAIKDSLNVYVENMNFLKSNGLYTELLRNKVASLNREQFLKSNPYFYQTADLLMSASALERNYFNIQSQNEFQLLCGFIVNNFNDLLKDYMLIHIFIMAEKDGIELIHDYIKLKEKAFSKYNLRDDKHDFDTDKLLLFDLMTIKSVTEIVRQYKDSVVLIDVWASWCGPCKKERPYLKLLEKKYRDKPIKFINFSIDENPFKWMEAVQEEDFQLQDSYLLLDYSNTNFVNINMVNTIPHFILLDRRGHIICKDAPWPNNPLLTDLLDYQLSFENNANRDKDYKDVEVPNRIK